MRLKSSRCLAVIAAATLATQAWAHHSHGNYVDTFMDIQGVVKEVHLVVRHSWVYLEVKDEKGEPQMWALEATGRAAGGEVLRQLRRVGDRFVHLPTWPADPAGHGEMQFGEWLVD